MRAFVTGTDTAVGKTFATALLARALRAAGRDTVALKPICSGDRSDAGILRAACGNELALDEVNPFWFRAPLAPLLAARIENRKISLPSLEQWFHDVAGRRRSVLVEGAGGWMTPVADGATIADLCLSLRLPVVLVVANRLGCVNHALLTIENIRRRGLECRGIILNADEPPDESAPTNRDLLEEFTDVPVILELARGQSDATLPFFSLS